MNRALQLSLVLFLGLSLAGSPLAGTLASQESIASESLARREIEELIRDSGATVSLAFRSLDGTQELFLNADARYDDPNALRIPVMIAVYLAAYAHAISLDDPVRSRGGSASATSTIGQLCQAMIADNSDPATNLLLERFSLSGVRNLIQSLGADGMEIGAAFPNSEKNHTTSRALLTLLWKLANERVVSSDASKEMLGLLARSPLHSVPPVSPVAAPPPKPVPSAGAPVAVREAVTIFGARSYVLVIQVQGLQDSSSSAELIAKITSALTKVM
ncbi:MAG TPA: serine hydrolase [Candidatus Limnocylindria bacterium]|nr:serine hydrolase [Candidatus Limnocylindria bacterium]